ncbi:MAG: heavy-metal-associated domain-containing protein [Myxococcales bacterium]|nr:heavy-metal-associated domain-containing protein [Myxococcales bacterium]
MIEAKYKVGGMTCGGCVRSVKTALERRLPGVQVEVELDAAVATLRGAHDAEAVREAVLDAGFEFGGPS